MKIESRLKDELAKCKTSLRKAEKELTTIKSELKDKTFRYDCIFQVLEKEQREVERLKSIVPKVQDTKSLEDKISGLSKECQELTRDLAGWRERERRYKERCEEIRKETEDVHRKVDYNPIIKAKLEELEVTYKEKWEAFKEQGDALIKIDLERK